MALNATNAQVLGAIFDAWSDGVEATRAAFHANFAADCTWEQSGLPTTTGPEEAAQFMDGLTALGFTAMDVKIVHMAESDGVVFTERVDWLVRPDGSRLGPWPVVGVTEFKDGKVVTWREYFDSRNLEMLAADAPSPPGSTEPRAS